MAEYVVERVVPKFVLGKNGIPKQGYSVVVTIPEFDEEHEIEVEKLDDALIDEKVRAFIETRRRIAQLGG